MKAITLYQPWASLIAIGAKLFETRGWKTNYRGPILIHAGLKPSHELDGITSEAICMAFGWPYKPYETSIASNIRALPHGAIIAAADIVECWSIVYSPGADIDRARHIPVGAELDVPKRHPRFGDIIVPSEQELLFGDWTPGRYAWELANVQMLPEPIPAKGRQGFWDFEMVAQYEQV